MKRFFSFLSFIFLLSSSIMYPYHIFADTPTPTPPCQGGICQTAVGAFHTDVSGFIGDVFRIILGASGGIALLLIISGGYKLMTSQGNSEKTQEARETITSAILGLLFIIFSTTLLEFIGIDVLGFGNIIKR